MGARDFNGSSDGLAKDGANLLASSGGPWVVMGWFQRDDATANQYAFTLKGAGANQFSMIYGFLDGNFEMFAQGFSGTDPRTDSALAVSDADWHHITYKKAASGTAEYSKFLDGSKTVINASATTTLGLSVDLKIGRSTSGDFFNGRIGPMVIVAADIPDSMITAIAGGSRPEQAGIQFDGYWPMGVGSPDADWSGNGLNLTVTGTTIVNGPPVRPSTPPWAASIPLIEVAAGGLVIPVAMHAYRQRHQSAA